MMTTKMAIMMTKALRIKTNDDITPEEDPMPEDPKSPCDDDQNNDDKDDVANDDGEEDNKDCLPQKRTQCQRIQSLRVIQKCRGHGRCWRLRTRQELRSTSQLTASEMSSPLISASPGNEE